MSQQLPDLTKTVGRVVAGNFILPGLGEAAEGTKAAIAGLTPKPPEAPPAAKVMPTPDAEAMKEARRRAAARMVATRTGRESTVLTGAPGAPSATLGGS